MLPVFDRAAYYRILSGGREELPIGKGRVIIEYTDGPMATNTPASAYEALQVANEQAKVATERDNIAAVYLILNHDGVTRLCGCGSSRAGISSGRTSTPVPASAFRCSRPSI